MRDRTRNDALHTGFTKERKAFDAALEIRHQAFEFGSNEFTLEIPCGRLAIPADMRGTGFIRPDQNAIGFFTQIGMRPRITHNRQFRLVINQSLQRLGDEIMMQHVGDRHIMSGPRAHHIAIRACGIHNMFADDVALVGDDFPLARRQKLNIGDERTAINFGAQFTRAGRHRIGDIGRRNMAVGDGEKRGLHTIEVQEGMDFADFFRPDDVGLIARKF